MSKKCPFEKSVLVTGASGGIGLVTAQLFAQQGFIVYATSRSIEEKIEEFPNGGRKIGLKMDVTNLESVQKAFEKIPELGIVIHCAGFGISGSAECTPIDRAISQMDTNYFGVLRVNSFALPLLRKNPRSLVLITSSVAGFVPIPYQSHYSSSKFALEAYAQALAMEASDFGVKVCLVEPGDTKTGFTAARTQDEAAQSPYFENCVKAVEKMAKDEQSGKDPISVAHVFLKIAGKKNPPPRCVVGFSYKLVAFLVRVLPSRLKLLILRKIY